MANPSPTPPLGFRLGFSCTKGSKILSISSWANADSRYPRLQIRDGTEKPPLFPGALSLPSYKLCPQGDATFLGELNGIPKKIDQNLTEFAPIGLNILRQSVESRSKISAKPFFSARGLIISSRSSRKRWRSKVLMTVVVWPASILDISKTSSISSNSCFPLRLRISRSSRCFGGNS